jgi:hypothetical protein
MFNVPESTVANPPAASTGTANVKILAIKMSPKAIARIV